MISRLFGSLGFARRTSSRFDEPNAKGIVVETYNAGMRLSPAAAKDEQRRLNERAEIIHRDLAWPGKVEFIVVKNEEAVPTRFRVSVESLDASLFELRPPLGSKNSRGEVVLKPGESASFQVLFLADAAPRQPTTSETVNIVTRRLDSAKASGHGYVLGSIKLQWMSFPSTADLGLRIDPPRLFIRPWAGKAVLEVNANNTSPLWPHIELDVQRARIDAVAQNEPERVASIKGIFPTGTALNWRVVLPGYGDASSYSVALSVNAKVGDGTTLMLERTPPIRVVYVPWLHKFRDWLLLFSLLIFGLWTVWGFPTQRESKLMVTLNFDGRPAGSTPSDASLKRLHPQVILLNHDGSNSSTLLWPIATDRNTVTFLTPQSWYGFRWATGPSVDWNIWSKAPVKYRLLLTKPSDDEGFGEYNFDDFAPDGSGIGQYCVTNSHGAFGLWTEQADFEVPKDKGVAPTTQKTTPSKTHTAVPPITHTKTATAKRPSIPPIAHAKIIPAKRVSIPPPPVIPSPVDTAINTAIAQSSSGNWESAINTLHDANGKALTNADKARLWRARALVYAKHGLRDDEQRAMAHAKSLDPSAKL